MSAGTFAVNQFGVVLSTRAKGIKAAEALRAFAAEHDGLVEVNFRRCELASAPFMQEFLRACHELGDRVIYSCLNEDINETLTFVENRVVPAHDEDEPGESVFIARCPEHGLHGERTECFVCGGPVEQVLMAPVPARDEDEPPAPEDEVVIAEVMRRLSNLIADLPARADGAVNARDLFLALTEYPAPVPARVSSEAEPRETETGGDRSAVAGSGGESE